MASIQVGSGEGGKRAIDHEVPLIPFIDLLLCCIMFLLVTAVWNKLTSVEANLPAGAIDGPTVPPELMMSVRADGYRVASNLGDEIHIALTANRYDVGALREHLRARRRTQPNNPSVTVSAEDGVQYAELIVAMDALSGEGYSDVTIGNGD